MSMGHANGPCKKLTEKEKDEGEETILTDSDFTYECWFMKWKPLEPLLGML